MPNTAKRNSFKATVLAAAIAVLPLATHAAGLGKITVLSALGQPLKAELEVTANRDEASSLVARLAADPATRTIPIILLTGIRHPEDLPLKYDAVKGMFEKPVKPETLFSAIEKCLV